MAYKAEEKDRGDRLPRQCTVTLDDPLFGETENFTLSSVKFLLLPADKNAEGIFNPTAHLLGYRIRAARQGIGAPSGKPGQKQFPKATGHVPRTGVKITNQFGTLVLDTQKEELLLTPTLKDLNAPPQGDPAGLELDHYKCYKVKPTKGQQSDQAPGGRFSSDLEATVEDQFADGLSPRCTPDSLNSNAIGKLCTREDSCGGVSGQTSFCQEAEHPLFGKARHFNVKKPLFLCNPVEKTNIDTTQTDSRGRTRQTSCTVAPSGPIKNKRESLVCYVVKVAGKLFGVRIDPKQAKHRRRAPFVLNQFPNPRQVQTKKELVLGVPSRKPELCVPSEVLDSGKPK
jgi:hypothetical protein